MAMFFDSKYEPVPYQGIQRQPYLGNVPTFDYKPSDFSGGMFGALKGITEGMAKRDSEDRKTKAEKEKLEAEMKAQKAKDDAAALREEEKLTGPKDPVKRKMAIEWKKEISNAGRAPKALGSGKSGSSSSGDQGSDDSGEEFPDDFSSNTTRRKDNGIVPPDETLLPGIDSMLSDAGDGPALAQAARNSKKNSIKPEEKVAEGSRIYKEGLAKYAPKDAYDRAAAYEWSGGSTKAVELYDRMKTDPKGVAEAISKMTPEERDLMAQWKSNLEPFTKGPDPKPGAKQTEITKREMRKAEAAKRVMAMFNGDPAIESNPKFRDALATGSANLSVDKSNPAKVEELKGKRFENIDKEAKLNIMSGASSGNEGFAGMNTGEVNVFQDELKGKIKSVSGGSSDLTSRESWKKAIREAGAANDVDALERLQKMYMKMDLEGKFDGEKKPKIDMESE